MSVIQNPADSATLNVNMPIVVTGTGPVQRIKLFRVDGSNSTLVQDVSNPSGGNMDHFSITLPGQPQAGTYVVVIFNGMRTSARSFNLAP